MAPSHLVALGPHCHDGLWMTFTEWVAEVKPAPERHCAVHVDDARGLGGTLRHLHDELRPFDGELGGLRELRGDIERLLGRLQPADDQQRDAIASLGERLDSLRTIVFESSLPNQALHGDVSLSNLLRTGQRLVWNDFEDTFRGPVHWDVASAVGSLRIRGADTRAVREMLDAYGWDDERDLASFSPLKRSTTRSGGCMTTSGITANPATQTKTFTPARASGPPRASGSHLAPAAIELPKR